MEILPVFIWVGTCVLVLIVCPIIQLIRNISHLAQFLWENTIISSFN